MRSDYIMTANDVQIRFKLGDNTTIVKAELYINGKYQDETEITDFIMMLETHANLKSAGPSSVTDDIIGLFSYPNNPIIQFKKKSKKSSLQ